MIKNLLYSLFLHFLLLLIIYANFNLKKIEEIKTSEISVSMVAVSGNNESNAIVENAAPPQEIKKEPEKKVEEEPKKQEETSPKKAEKDKAKPQPKKLAQATPAKAIPKPAIEKKINDLKKEEKPEVTQNEAKKIKQDKIKNDHQDEVKKDDLKKEKDLGAKEKAKEEQKETKPTVNNQTVSNTANNVDSIDLSAREKFNIQSQLRRCYKRALDESGSKNKAKVIIQLHVSEDGYVDSNLDDVIDKTLYKNSPNNIYKTAIDNVRRAIELCNPLRNLPLDKYEVWKDATLEFSEEEDQPAPAPSPIKQ